MMPGQVASGTTLAQNISKVTQSFCSVDQIHARALEISSKYKRAEADLIDVLQEVEEHRVFIGRGHSSLFQYVVEELGLSESNAYGLITVARKARQVPELKTQIRSGEITLSKARRIVSVLTPQNQAEWLSKASFLSGRQLEKEVVKVRPCEATPERASYVNFERVKLELGLSEREMLRLRRVQDLMSQAKKRALSLEEVVEALNNEYLHRHDPVERAKRHRVRQAIPFQSSDLSDDSKNPSKSIPIEPVKTLFPGRVHLLSKHKDGSKIERALQQNQSPNLRSHPKREPIPAAILHQVNLRDQRRCTHLRRDGTRCNQARWIEIHHKVPVSQGGPHTLENLVTLCSTHHKFAHL